MNKTIETQCLDIMLKVRASLRAAVKEFSQTNFDAEGLKTQFVYSDGKTYEIKVKEIRK